MENTLFLHYKILNIYWNKKIEKVSFLWIFYIYANISWSNLAVNLQSNDSNET